MEKIVPITIKMQLEPYEIHTPYLNTLQERFNDSLFKKYYIQEIQKIDKSTGGRILNDGKILINVTAICKVLDPDIDSVYSLRITNMNKMGALHKNNLVTVFIPQQYYNNESPEVDSTFNIKIIGKRIEDSIVCVGKIV